MARDVTVTIDGRVVEVAPGTLIIQAAKKAGIEIPVFCYDERLRSVGACRMCLVEVERMPKLIASCATPVVPGMVIHTQSERVLNARKGVLEFLLINHPLDCPTCEKGGECPLQNLTYQYGPAASRYAERKIRFLADTNQKFDEIALGPEIILCRNRCIMCYRCTRIVRELAGEADLGVFKRGALANINALKDVQFADEFSGNTVEYCPVGALTSRSFRYKIRSWLLKKTPSICNLCSDGCNMNIEWSQGKVYRHMSRRHPEIDDGWLCDRGRYSFDIAGSRERIMQPLVRRRGKLLPCQWDEAMGLIGDRLRRTIDENLGEQVAAVGSPLLSNEEAFGIRRFFGDAVGTMEIDFQTDTDQPLEPRLLDLVGLSGTIADLENDDFFLFVACDPAIEHPIVSLRIKKAVSQKGAGVVMLGSYDKRLGYFPVTNIRTPFAAERLAIDFVAARLAGTPPPSSELAMDIDKLEKVAKLLESSSRAHIVAGRGFFCHPNRSALLASLLKLRKASNARLSILPTQGNFLGVSRFGLFGGTEHSFSKILCGIEEGRIKAAFVFGANPLDEFPDRRYVHEQLKKLEFLAVVTPFMTPTASLASVVLPQAMLPNYGGTFVNIEGRLQCFQPIGDGRGSEGRPVWSIIGELADLLGVGSTWYHDSQVRQEMAHSLKGMSFLSSLPEGGRILPSPLKAEDYEPEDVRPEIIPKPGREFPYLLQWTPSVTHSNWLTEKSESLRRIDHRQTVWMHPRDAVREGITEGQVVRIGVADTAINLPVSVTSRVNEGELLVVNSFSDNPVNRLMKRNARFTFVSLRKN